MGKLVELSDRMRSIADMVTPGNVVCDVGCDHGFLSIYLVQSKIAPFVIAMDVKSGPLSGCEKHVEQYGLKQYITMRLSDGLNALEEGEADTVIIAGMGGRLMQKILTEGCDKAVRVKELILQPQSEIRAFREFLRWSGYQIVAENLIEEEGKFYPMMKVIPGSLRGTDEEDDLKQTVYDRFGKLLLQDQSPGLLRFLKEREQLLCRIRGEIISVSGDRALERLKEIEDELRDIETAYEYYK